MKKNRILISTLACLWLIWPKLNADADNECNAVETARMILNVIRIEHAVWVAEKELQGDAARASQLLVEFLSQPESSWKKHIHNRSGPAAEIIARLKATLANLEIPSPDDDPAAVITQILADRADNPAADNPLFHTGYAAAFLLNMEEKKGFRPYAGFTTLSRHG